MESEMSNLQEQYKLVEQTYGQDVLNLVLAKGYLAKLLENESARHYLQRHQPDLSPNLNPSSPRSRSITNSLRSILERSHRGLLSIVLHLADHHTLILTARISWEVLSAPASCLQTSTSCRSRSAVQRCLTNECRPHPACY